MRLWRRLKFTAYPVNNLRMLEGNGRSWSYTTNENDWGEDSKHRSQSNPLLPVHPAVGRSPPDPDHREIFSASQFLAPSHGAKLRAHLVWLISAWHQYEPLLNTFQAISARTSPFSPFYRNVAGIAGVQQSAG